MSVTVADQAVLSLDAVMESARLTDLNRNRLAYVREVLMSLNDQDYTEAIIDLVRDLPGELRVDKLYQLTVTRGLEEQVLVFRASDYPFDHLRDKTRQALTAEVTNGSS